MNHLRIFAVLCALFVSNIFAEDEHPAITAAKAADLSRGKALRSANTNALREILAQDFKYTHSNGFVETKATHIKSFVDGLRYTRFDTTNVVGHVITPDV